MNIEIFFFFFYLITTKYIYKAYHILFINNIDSFSRNILIWWLYNNSATKQHTLPTFYLLSMINQHDEFKYGKIILLFCTVDLKIPQTQTWSLFLSHTIPIYIICCCCMYYNNCLIDCFNCIVVYPVFYPCTCIVCLYKYYIPNQRAVACHK